MARAPIPTQATIISLLQERPHLLSELREATQRGRAAVITTISRLRDKQWQIVSETSPVAGDPRYILLAGPGSPMGARAFLCPACRWAIRLGHVEDHSAGCQFGPRALREINDNPQAGHIRVRGAR